MVEGLRQEAEPLARSALIEEDSVSRRSPLKKSPIARNYLSAAPLRLSRIVAP